MGHVKWTGPKETAKSNKKPKCKLIGQDGNVFYIIGTVRRTLKDAGLLEQAKELIERTAEARSYDEVLAIAAEYVEIY